MEMKEKVYGLCEAYEYYTNMLSEELQAKVPQEFVIKMEKYSKSNCGVKIEKLSDLEMGKISKEGLKYIKYINLCIHDGIL